MPHLQIPRHGLQQFRGRRLARLELTESDIECSGWNTNVAGKQWSSWSEIILQKIILILEYISSK